LVSAQNEHDDRARRDKNDRRIAEQQEPRNAGRDVEREDEWDVLARRLERASDELELESVVGREELLEMQQAIEQVASTNFPAAPVASTVNVDVNGDGTNDYVVAVAKPVCQNSIPIKLVELDITKAGDIPCFGSGVSPAPGVPMGGSGNSLCANTQWDISATVTDPTTNTGTTVTVHQGIGQRVPIGTTC